ncbi:MAG: squalene synthase HpnC [Ignavibacteriaceae bacterium]|nr:squalene synthase HpnC [Ignavibacteriaceae bacterium]
MTINQDKEKAYSEALHFAKTHYENFPVVSFLIKKELRKDIAIIYWFARTADDIADEGTISEEKRLQNLDSFQLRLDELLKGNFNSGFELALYTTIKERQLTVQLFYDLLSAFRQDVTKKRYSSFSELLDYCRRSANPVGRLILELHNIRNEDANKSSDNICTALQLTNFYQDTRIDFQKGRIYYPVEEWEKFGVREADFSYNITGKNLRSLVKFNIERTGKLFEEGRNLLKYLSGTLRYEIGWTILGGEAVLRKITLSDFDVLKNRPKLKAVDFVILLSKTPFIK